MILSQSDAIRLFQVIEDMQQRIEDLEALVNEQREFVVGSSFPVDAFGGQVVLRIDQPGGAGGGTLYRFDSGADNWIQVV